MAYRKIHIAGHGILLQWVPGHCSIVGNDQANHATEALSYTRTNIALLRDDRQAILSHTMEPMASRQWAADITSASVLATADPTLALQLPRNMLCADAALIHRTRLNVAFTGQLQCLLRQVDPTNCHHSGQLADLEHIFLHCPYYQRFRTTLTTSLNQLDSQTLRMSTLIGPWTNPTHQCTALKTALDFLRFTLIFTLHCDILRYTFHKTTLPIAAKHPNHNYKIKVLLVLKLGSTRHC